jgi:hypothetical protein
MDGVMNVVAIGKCVVATYILAEGDCAVTECSLCVFGFGKVVYHERL